MVWMNRTSRWQPSTATDDESEVINVQYSDTERGRAAC